jgi:hypothetical protein
MPPPSNKLISTRLAEINDLAILNLVLELELTTGAFADKELSLLKFLQSCIHRGGAFKPSPITTKELSNPLGNLSREVGKFRDSVIYEVCDELAWNLRGARAELWEDTKLRVFFNKVLPIPPAPKLTRKKAARRSPPKSSINNWGWISSN